MTLTHRAAQPDHRRHRSSPGARSSDARWYEAAARQRCPEGAGRLDHHRRGNEGRAARSRRQTGRGKIAAISPAHRSAATRAPDIQRHAARRFTTVTLWSTPHAPATPSSTFHPGWPDRCCSTAVYFTAGRISMLFSALPGHSSFLWLPSGIALAALLIGGIRLAPGVALGAFAVQYSAGSSLSIALAAAVGATLSAITGAVAAATPARFFSHAGSSTRRAVLDRRGRLRCSHHLRHRCSRTPPRASSLIPWSDLAIAWAVCWAGEALGILLIAPVLLSWPARAESPPAKPAAPRIALVLLQLLVGTFVFALKAGPGGRAYVYLALAFVTAMFLPLAWVTAANAADFRAAAAGTLLGQVRSAPADFASLQIYAIASSLATLMLASLAQERETVAAELRDSAGALQAAHLSVLRLVLGAGRKSALRADRRAGGGRATAASHRTSSGARAGISKRADARGARAGARCGSGGAAAVSRLVMTSYQHGLRSSARSP